MVVDGFLFAVAVVPGIEGFERSGCRCPDFCLLIAFGLVVGIKAVAVAAFAVAATDCSWVVGSVGAVAARAVVAG